MKFYLVRHGESQFNAGITDAFDSGITDKGHTQAIRAAMTLREEVTGDYIGYTSPYLRCLQTAMHIAQCAGIKFIVTPLLGETPEEIHRNVPTVVHNNAKWFDHNFDWSSFPPTYNYGVETDEQYQQRMYQFIKILDKNCVVVSHRAPITFLLRHLCYGGKNKELNITNGSISLVENDLPVYMGVVP